MKKRFLFLLVLSLLLGKQAYCLDISSITNPSGWTQTYHTQTYTVGSDGVSLLYRNQDTGMRLNTPGTAGGKIQVVDSTIPVRSRTPATGTTGAGTTGAGTAGAGIRLTTKAKIFKGLGVIGGGLLVYQGTVGNGPHSWGDVISGALGGLTMGASVGSLTGPAYPFVVAGTTIVGAMAGGAKFFSESGGDCVYDPIMLGGGVVYTCCNTVFNKGMRWVGPGGMMFCEMPDGSPGVHTCLNGGSTTTDSMWKQDEWSPCQSTDAMWCPGVSAPADENGVVYIPTLNGLQSKVSQQQTSSKIQGKVPQSQTLTEDELKNVNICWDWNCDTELGFHKSGNVCVYGQGGTSGGTGGPSGGTTVPDPYDVIIKRIQSERQRIIDMCGYAINSGTSIL